MFKEKILLFYVAETSIHPGSGSEVGIVDLPIQREVHTEVPIIRGSSLKGAFRDYWRELKRKNANNIEEEKKKLEASFLELIFGPEPEEGESESFASAASFTDARLLLFPIKSYKNIFAYITCPAVLKKFIQDLKWTGIKINDFLKEDLKKVLEKAVETGKAIAGNEMNQDGYVILEEHKFNIKSNINNFGKNLAEVIFGENAEDFRKEKVERHLVILSDDDFRFFIKHSTEVIARIKIDQKTGTVKSGGLWYEENLPSESILYNLVLFSDSRKPATKEKKEEEEKIYAARDIKDAFNDGIPEILQLGGNETVGRGFLRIYGYAYK